MLTRSTGNSPISSAGCRARTAGLVVLAVLAQASTSNAQQQPTPFPWERDAKKFYNQGIPRTENPLDRRIQDGLRKLGLPDQPQLDITKETEPEAEPPGLSQSVMPELDGNRDGYVSRGEYFSSRQRVPTVGNRGSERSLQRRDRIDSRFRAADRDRDGRLSPEEIDRMQDRRF